jgi:hypothetical protein
MKTKCRQPIGLPKTHLFLAVAPLAVLLPASLQASSLLVNWGGDYVLNYQPFSGSTTRENNLDLDGVDGNNDSRFGIAHNKTSPAPLSPSNGYSGTSGTFYGGYVINTINNPEGAGQTLQPNAAGAEEDGPDYLRLETQHSGNYHHTFAYLVYWDKSDFLNGGNTQTITLDMLSAFSLNIRNSSNFTDHAHLHFVLRNGTQFYTSEAFYNGVGASAENGFLGAVPDGGIATYNPIDQGFGWKPYDPDGLDLQWTHGGYLNPTFDNITGVGFYFDTLGFDQNHNDIEIRGFSFSAVPEHSIAFLAIGGFGMMTLIRKRR